MEKIVVRVYPSGGVHFISEKEMVEVMLIQHTETGLGKNPVIASVGVSEVNPDHVRRVFDIYGEIGK